MDPLVAAFLGAVQGLTEFLPVSSSGHVAMGALLFGIEDMPLSMVIVVHAGTLIATLLVVGTDVRELAVATAKGLGQPGALLATDHGRTLAGVVIASVPTAVLGLALERQVEAASHSPVAVGAFLLVTAVAVGSTLRRHEPQRDEGQTLSWGGYLFVGVVQGLAVMPGISRSGATIVAAMWLGMRAPEAFRFSFLLSLPAIGGAVALELVRPDALATLGLPAAIAGGVALVTGWGALVLLRRVVVAGRLWWFALYLVPVAVGLLAWGLIRD